LARAAFDDYLKEILHQRAIWEKKPVVRKIYHHRYEKVVRAFSPLRPVIEVGSGSGNFKEYFPEVVSTDVFQSGPWIDRVMDAHDLNLSAGEALPLLRLMKAVKSGFFLGPPTRGFSGSSLVPAFGFPALLKLEDAITSPVAKWLTGMHMMIVLEKV
jgi:hypothetical protein